MLSIYIIKIQYKAQFEIPTQIMVFIFHIKFEKYNICNYLYDGTYKILLII